MKKESLGQCNGRVWHPGIFKSSQCPHRASITRDGVPYCGIHDPVRKKEKADARYAEYRKKQDEKYGAWERMRIKREAHEPMLNALKVIAKTTAIQAWLASNDPKALAQVLEAIAKAENG